MFRSLVAAIVLLSAPLAAAGQTTPKNPELSTPRLAALTFVRAMETNNMEAFQAVTIGTADDYKLFEPLLGMVGAAKQLEKAAREKFGREGRLVARDSPAVELEVHVQESDVTINGDTAVLRHKGEEDADPLRLKQTPAGWKVDLTAIPNRQSMSAAAGGMRKLQQALDDCTADIRAGRFKTAAEAEQTLLKRMKEAAEAAQNQKGQ